MAKTRIQVTTVQLKQLNNLKVIYNCCTHSELLDLLLKNQKYFIDLENRVKHIHSLSNL